jgi:membrane-associated phospholipid phosphatase
MSELVARVRRTPAPAWTGCVGFVVAWAALLAMVQTGRGLARDDAPVLGWVVGHRTGALSSLFEAVSDTAVDGVAAVLSAGVVLLVAVRARSPRPVLTLGASVVGAVVLAELVKAVVHRARPAPATMLGVPETGSGFPSAHTLVLTALAGAVALVLWRATASAVLRALAVTAAVVASAVMGASRLYLGDHWLTDVLAGYALAGAVLTAVAALTRPGPAHPVSGLPGARRERSQEHVS